MCCLAEFVTHHSSGRRKLTRSLRPLVPASLRLPGPSPSPSPPFPPSSLRRPGWLPPVGTKVPWAVPRLWPCCPLCLSWAPPCLLVNSYSAVRTRARGHLSGGHRDFPPQLLLSARLLPRVRHAAATVTASSFPACPLSLPLPPALRGKGYTDGRASITWVG